MTLKPVTRLFNDITLKQLLYSKVMRIVANIFILREQQLIWLISKARWPLEQFGTLSAVYSGRWSQQASAYRSRALATGHWLSQLHCYSTATQRLCISYVQQHNFLNNSKMFSTRERISKSNVRSRIMFKLTCDIPWK